MKDILLSTLDPTMTIMMCSVLITGAMNWTNMTYAQPGLPNLPSPKHNSFL